MLDTDGRDISFSSSNAMTQSQKYWFDDGTLVVQVQDHAYRMHGGLLDRLSSRFSSLPRTQDARYNVPSVIIPSTLVIVLDDFEALLDHLYHDIPLDSDTHFARVAAILRVSSGSQLDFPSINALARRRLLDIFPTRPEDFVHFPDAPDDALSLAIEYDIVPIQKSLYYRVATHLHLDDVVPDDTLTAEGTSDDAIQQSDAIARLPPEQIHKCKVLLDRLIEHFTPILFTVATAHHMSCTDVFAEKWMPLVIQPALENNRLCKPIETLQTIMDLDWKSEGLCEDCVKDKREEWRGEQRDVWNKMDGWLNLTK